MPERGLLIAERSEERTESPPEFIEDRPTRFHSRPRKNPEVQFQAPTGQKRKGSVEPPAERSIY